MQNTETEVVAVFRVTKRIKKKLDMQVASYYAKKSIISRPWDRVRLTL